MSIRQLLFRNLKKPAFNPHNILVITGVNSPYMRTIGYDSINGFQEAPENFFTPTGPVIAAFDGANKKLAVATTTFNGTHRLFDTAAYPFGEVSTFTGDVAATLNSLRFSHSGAYLAAGISATPEIRVFSKSGNVVTNLNQPTTGTGAAVDAAIDRTDVYLGVLNSSVSTTQMFKRSGSTFGSITGPTNSGTKFCLEWSPTSDHCAVSPGNANRLGMYVRSGDVFSDGTISSQPTVIVRALKWRPDGNHLAVGVNGNTGNGLTVYNRSTNALGIINNAAPLIGNIVSIDFSSDGLYMFVLFQDTTNANHYSIAAFSISGSSYNKEAVFDLGSTVAFSKISCVMGA